VLIVGGGMAGHWAAIRATECGASVLVVDKAKVIRSGASIYAHAYGAPAIEGKYYEKLEEMVVRSSYLGDQVWFELMLDNIGERLDEMERFGVQFELDEQGNRKGGEIRGQSKGFCVLAKGMQVMKSMHDEAQRRKIKFIENVAIFDLLTSDGKYPTSERVVGAVGVHRHTGEFIVFKASAVIITSGLISGKLHRYSMNNMTGDGYAAAFRAGAEITGLEFSQQPWAVWMKRFCAGGVGQFQHGGASLVNAVGEEFLKKYEGSADDYIGFKGQFDQGALCRAIVIEHVEGRGPCYIDCMKWTDEKINTMRSVLPMTMRAFDEPGVGLDLKKELLEVTPMAGHYGLSCQCGIHIDTCGATKVTGLFAAGSAAYYGGGPSPQSFAITGGYRAGEFAAKLARDSEKPQINKEQVENVRCHLMAPMTREKGITPDEIYNVINKIVVPWSNSIFKHGSRLEKAISEIRDVEAEMLTRVTADGDVHELVKAAESRNFALLMGLYNRAALERKESRMVHFREEFPFQDDVNWTKLVLVGSGDNGSVYARTQSVNWGRTAIVPEKFTKTPAFVPYSMEKALSLSI